MVDSTFKRLYDFIFLSLHYLIILLKQLISFLRPNSSFQGEKKEVRVNWDFMFLIEAAIVH